MEGYTLNTTTTVLIAWAFFLLVMENAHSDCSYKNKIGFNIHLYYSNVSNCRVQDSCLAYTTADFCVIHNSLLRSIKLEYSTIEDTVLYGPQDGARIQHTYLWRDIP